MSRPRHAGVTQEAFLGGDAERGVRAAIAAIAGIALDDLEEHAAAKGPGVELVERAARMGTRLRAELEARFGDHPHVGDIRGRGLFLGLELVEDRASRMPFDPALGLHKAIKAAAFEDGLICYPMGGTIDGVRGDHILLAPPFILEDAHIAEICDRLERALERRHVDRVADFVRDVTYAGIGAWVIAAQKVDAEVRKLAAKAA